MFNKLDIEEITNYLKTKDMDCSDRTIEFDNGVARVFFIPQITDRAELTKSVIKPLVEFCSSNRKSITAQIVANCVIYADQCSIDTDVGKIEEILLSGRTVIVLSTDKNFVIVNLKKVEQRNISEPQISYSLRGPQDSFTESLEANLSLVRYRIRDENLKIKYFQVGVRTKSKVAVIYIKDIANETVVNEIQKRIMNVKVDGLVESGELQSFLLNNRYQIFPQMGLVERSDMAAQSLIEGKVLVLVDGSGISLLAPKTFIEFFYSSDDRYDNKFFGMFSRLIRFFAVLTSFVLPSLYVGTTSFHTDILPVEYAIILSQMNITMPYNSLIATLILELIIELLRESLLRIPKHIGLAIGIVGAIVIGQAAVTAGMFSPLLLIIVTTSMLGSFAIPDYSLMNSFRVLKFGLLLFTGVVGFYGFVIFLTFITIELVSLNSFGVPYFVPWAPFNLRGFRKSMITDVVNDKERPEYLKTKDKIRVKRKK